MDSENAGVKLRADFSALSPLPSRVRFWRGDGTLVRSGDPAYAPGGIAHAYDHEAPIGAPATYWVQPVDADLNAAGDASDSLTVQLADTSDVRDMWLKSPTRPDLSMRVWVETAPDITQASTSTMTRVPGARLGIVSVGVRSGQEMTLTIVTETAEEAAALDALLDAGILLAQTKSDYGLPGFYCVPGDVQRSRVANMSNLTSRWTVPLVECRRPATLDAPLRIPGLSWAAVTSHYPTWQELASRVASWDELIWGGLGEPVVQYDVLDGGSFDSVGPGVLDMGGF